MSKKNLDRAFHDDEKRTKLSLDGKSSELKKTYKISRNIKNPNTGTFWDTRFSESNKETDYMAEDRIKKAADLMPQNSQRILNIGIGSGALEKRLMQADEDIRLNGIDITSKTLSIIKKKYKGIFKKGSIYNIPFRKKFDTIFVLEVLEHLPSERVFNAYEQVKKLLKPRGSVIFSIPVNERYSSRNNPNGHLRRYSPQLFEAELKIAGFKINKIEKLYAFKSGYKLKTFLAKNIFKNRWKPNVILLRAQKK